MQQTVLSTTVRQVKVDEGSKPKETEVQGLKAEIKELHFHLSELTTKQQDKCTHLEANIPIKACTDNEKESELQMLKQQVQQLQQLTVMSVSHSSLLREPQKKEWRNKYRVEKTHTAK